MLYRDVYNNGRGGGVGGGGRGGDLATRKVTDMKEMGKAYAAEVQRNCTKRKVTDTKVLRGIFQKWPLMRLEKIRSVETGTWTTKELRYYKFTKPN